jgi:carboxypeptidase Taq
VLLWDQNTHMPPGGHATRADQLGTLERIVHDRQVDPELGRLLDALEPWAEGEDPDSDGARLVGCARRDHEKAVRVPADLAETMAREAAAGYAAWLNAHARDDFGAFSDALARSVELRREYAACFPAVAHPYDALLDDYEPGLTLAEVRPLFDALVAGLTPLIEAAGEAPAVLTGDFPLDAQRALVDEVLGAVGFDPATWRIDESPHPFAQSPGPGDVRLTTRYRPDDLGWSLYSALHEFGHGLYDAGYGPELRRTPLHSFSSLGVHESQSRLWENMIGRGRPFSAWLLPQLRRHLPAAFGAMDHETLYAGLNRVERTLIRTEADETTYNLHVALRLDLEVALVEGSLEAADAPHAWAEAVDRMLGLEVRSDREGVLQDVHWSTGDLGYFPTYTVGNLMAAQLWRQLRHDLGDVDAQLEAGEFAPVRAWLGEHIHRHGRKFTQSELLRRATGEELGVQALLDYLGAKLRDAGVLA